MIVNESKVHTKAHVGCLMCGQHMWVAVDAVFFTHDSGAITYEFTATAQVAAWYNSHRKPFVIKMETT